MKPIVLLCFILAMPFYFVLDDGAVIHEKCLPLMLHHNPIVLTAVRYGKKCDNYDSLIACVMVTVVIVVQQFCITNLN